MELKNSETFKNLKKAFIAECAARTRYEFVEYGERYNGYEGLAEIVDKIAYQEFNHARMLYTHIEKVTDKTINNESVSADLPFRQRWNLKENLKLTAEDEENEAKFYKNAKKTAEKEGFKDIAALFDMIEKVEIKHKKIFEYLYEKLNSDELYKSDVEKRWICSVCGYEEKGNEAFKECPLCKAKLETVKIILPKELAV